MKLILVRHGETEENTKGLLGGHEDGHLTGNGKLQAQKLALRLKNENLDAIFSSDLKRAKDTAVEVSKFHNLEVQFNPLLREKSHGEFEGRPYSDLDKAISESGVSKANFKPENGESYSDVKDRANRFLGMIFPKFLGKTVLIVSHRGFIRMMLGILLKKPVEEALQIDLHNTAVNIIRVSDTGSHTAHMINSIEHL